MRWRKEDEKRGGKTRRKIEKRNSFRQFL